MKWIVVEKTEKMIVFAVFALALFLSAFQLTSTPRVWVDEGVFTEAAKNLAISGVPGLQTEPGTFFPLNNLLSVGYPVIFPVAGSFSLFGVGIWQARLPMLGYMLLLLISFYLFAKKRYGFFSAILSVLMLMSFAPFYGNGRPVQGEVAGLVFLALGSWLLLFWEESNFSDKKFAMLSGAAFGLAAATKPIYLIILSCALIVTLVLWSKRIENKKVLLVFGTAFLVPVILWLFITFSSMEALMNSFSTYVYLAGNHGSSLSTTETMVTNLLRFFSESTPILFSTLLFAAIFSFWHRYRNKDVTSLSMAECLILCFIIINFVAYLKGTGWYRYFFPAHTLLYLLFPAAILTLANLSKKVIVQRIMFAIIPFLILFQFFHLVFLSDVSFVVRQTGSQQLSAALSEIDPSQKVLFYNAVEATVFMKGNNYSQYLEMENFLVAGNKNSLTDPVADFILVSRSRDDNYSLPCYENRSVSRYELFQRISDCKI